MFFAKTFSVRESAEYLGVSTKTVRRYLKRGLLQHKITEGKHGPEIRILKRSLDKIRGQIEELSKGREDIREILHLYQEASPEVREVVLKILRSSSEVEETEKSNGLITAIFRRKGDDYQ